MKNCLRVGILFCCVLLSSCGGAESVAQQPDEFQTRLRVDTVSDSVMAWACATAKDLGVKSLKSQYPESDVSRKSGWLLKPKEVYYAEQTITTLRRWFFYFVSDEGYYIKFVVNDDKQVSGLDAGRRVVTAE